MDQVQERGNKEDNMKEEITTKEPFIQEGQVELIDISHLLTQLGSLMHMRIRG
jgi:hypothetical protein